MGPSMDSPEPETRTQARLEARPPAAAARKVAGVAWFQTVSGKVAALVVFLVAFTTLLGNLLELDAKRKRLAIETANTAAASEVSAPVSAQASAPVATAAPAIRRLHLQLERIAVQHRGAMGRPDWQFAVEADGQPLFNFRQDDVDDAAGRNVARVQDLGALLRPRMGQQVTVTVKGWRLRKFRGAAEQPEVSGQATLQDDGSLAPIQVQADTPEAGAFVFYFSADPQ